MFYQNCFAAAAWADDNGCFAFFNGKRNIVENNIVAKLLCKILNNDYFAVFTHILFLIRGFLTARMYHR